MCALLEFNTFMTFECHPTMNQPLPISVCMIVRDEEMNLPDALASVRSIAAAPPAQSHCMQRRMTRQLQFCQGPRWLRSEISHL